MKGAAENEERLQRLRTQVTKVGIVAYVLLDAELAASMWGRWGALGWFGLISVLGILANVVINRRAKQLGSLETERLRAALNLLVILVVCHLSGWGFPGLAMIVLIGAAQGGSGAPQVVELTAAVALVAGLAAGADGVGWLTALTLATAVEGAFWLVYGSARVGSDLVVQLGARHSELAAAHAELERMQHVALQQDKLAGLGLMAAGIAHEINNPMSYVTSNVISLLADLRAARGLPPAIQEYVDDVLPETIDGIRRVNAIVSDMRRFARDDSAKSECYDLNEQVEHALRLASSQLKQRCQVVRDLGELPELNGRPQQITQVLVNLIVNAAQANPQGGTVTVVTRRSGSEAIVSVRDTGIGMTAEIRKHLFEPFFTTKPVGEGTGLGLAVIHGLVSGHGGRIEVDSEVGRGSCFTVYLPLNAAVANAAPRQPTGTWRIQAIVASGNRGDARLT